MRNRRSTELIALASAVVASVTFFLASCEFLPRLDRKLHAAIGKALAKEAIALLGNGGQLTLITRDTEEFPQPALDVLLASFRREVRRTDAKITATHLVQADPLRPVDVPPGDFYELIRRASAQHVIVSLLGPPLLTGEQRNKLGQAKPKIVAFCSGSLTETVDLRQLFSAGLLHAAVINRPASSFAASQQSISPGFDQLYRVVKAEDFSGGAQPTASVKAGNSQ
ncbi:MAG: hypothetical protein L0Z50_06785 [Verrucomicrobiales bacterium]|nr:hypothetical protein [Verrucomicrobiales bacterium]